MKHVLGHIVPANRNRWILTLSSGLALAVSLSTGSCGGGGNGGGGQNTGGSDASADTTGPSSDASEDTSMPRSDGAPDAPGVDALVDGPEQDVRADAPFDAPADAAEDAPVDSSPVPSCDGSVSCTTPSACPTPSTECVLATCPSGCCDTAPASLGTTCKDNGGTICDGKGNCVGCNKPSDCPTQSTACVLDTCAANVCGTTFAKAGSACSDNGGTNCTASGTCVPQCKDGVQDGNETGVDCGGGTCARCPLAGGCLTNTDCNNGTDGGVGFCSFCGDATNHKCVSTHCADCQIDDGESDVDCGQVCPTKCGANNRCFNNFDCNGLACTFTDGGGKTCQ
jgi:hypothetical protein